VTCRRGVGPRIELDGVTVKTGRDSKSRDRKRRELQTLLRTKRAELTEDYKRCLSVLQDPTSVDLDNGEVADYEDRTEAAMVADHLLREIREIDQALTRLARGEYGVCASCGLRIPISRLAANPTAQRCVGCQATAERKVG
jgi:RNA polymerase-binding protein DksA